MDSDGSSIGSKGESESSGERRSVAAMVSDIETGAPQRKKMLYELRGDEDSSDGEEEAEGEQPGEEDVPAELELQELMNEKMVQQTEEPTDGGYFKMIIGVTDEEYERTRNKDPVIGVMKWKNGKSSGKIPLR